MNTLLLDIVAWDLVLDVHGNIAVASDPYSQAQDAASAIRTVLGEVYYDITIGVNFSNIIGTLPPVALMKAQFQAAALTVPGVVSAQVFLSALNNRTVTGQVQITNTPAPASTPAFINPILANANQSAGTFRLDFSSLGGPNVLG